MKIQHAATGIAGFSGVHEREQKGRLFRGPGERAEEGNVLSQGNKPPEEPSSYRPLCLLDIARKLFERIICAMLETII